MADPTLERLADEVRAGLHPPAYDVLRDRARLRRRRRAGGAVVASALVVAGLFVGLGPGGPTALAPAESVPSASASAGQDPGSVDPEAQTIVDDPDSVVTGLSASPRGDLLAVWQQGSAEQAPTAVAVRSPDGTTYVRSAPSGLFHLEPLDGSEVGWTGYVPGADGASSVVTIGVDGQVGEGVTRDTIYGIDSVLTASGARVVSPPGEDVSRWSTTRDGRTTTGVIDEGSGVSTLLVAGSGDYVVIVAGRTQAGSGRTGATIERIGISDDGGRTWRSLAVPGEPTQVRAAVSAGVTTSGTVLVTSGGGPLLRVRPGGTVESEGLSGQTARTVTASGERLFALGLMSARGGAGTNSAGPTLSYSDDGGETWTTAPLPGRG